MINLLPPEVLEARAYGRRISLVASSGLLLVSVTLCGIALVLAGTMIVALGEQDIRDEIAAQESALVEANAVRSEIDKLNKNVIAVDKIYGLGIQFSELIPKVGAALPPGSFITGLTLDENNNKAFELRVNINQQITAAVVQQNLINSGVFAFADIIRISPPPEAGQYTDAAIKSAFSDTSGFIRTSPTPAASTPAATPASGGAQ